MIMLQSVSKRHGEINLDINETTALGLRIGKNGTAEADDVSRLAKLLQIGKAYFGFEKIEYMLQPLKKGDFICRILVKDKSKYVKAQPVFVFENGEQAVMFMCCTGIEHTDTDSIFKELGKITIVSEEKIFTPEKLKRCVAVAEKLGGFCASLGIRAKEA